MRLVLTTVMVLIVTITSAQVKWSEGKKAFRDIGWDNYSTSFIDAGNITQPFIVTAIPYNGTYSNFDDINSELDMIFDSSLYRFRSNFSNYGRRLYTYDSSEVYFLAPGIFRTNADQYSYRVLLNGNEIVVPWQEIDQFADSAFGLNDFKKGMAFLGGYKAGWNNFLVIELKRNDRDTAFSGATVYWKQTKPELAAIYTIAELNSFLARLKKSNDYSSKVTDADNWKSRYEPDQLDPRTGLPKKLQLAADENNLIFYLQGNIVKKEALEYQVLRNGSVALPWKANDFDNNVIWLKSLSPGEYQLQMRFRAQRHNPSFYFFTIAPRWYQTFTFNIVAVIVLTALMFLLFLFWKEQRKTIIEKKKKEKLQFELLALRSQLNPHFVFNALSSIQGLINKNEIEAANHYLTEFSRLLRSSLNNKDAEYVALREELKILETYIKLEQLRFHFSYTMFVDDQIAVDVVEVPALLIQPLVENAIKHGAGPANEQGILSVRFYTSHRNLIVKISDNGKGFKTAPPEFGFGLTMVSERIKLLNESLTGQHISLEFNKSSMDPGTVHLNFQNWL